MKFTPVLVVFAVCAIATALWQLHWAQSDVAISAVTIDSTPAMVYRPLSSALGPVVVIAHGFAGSQQLMQSFALCFARNGYIAVTFDFPGHGRNPKPLSGSITEETGATRLLVQETARVAAFARPLGDGRLAVLGHSMASDIVVRFAQSTPDIAATIAVSMFSPAVSATTPADLLVIVGDWESGLKQEALRAISLATLPMAAAPGITYGDVARGSGRRVSFIPTTEHVSVLFSRDSLGEALVWLDQAFGTVRTRPPVLDSRGRWILLLLAGSVLLAYPLTKLLPRLTADRAAEPAAPNPGWRRRWLPLLLPMLLTPLVLRLLPTHFLPVLVGDYLAAHFALYGLLTALCLLWAGRDGAVAAPRRVSLPSFAGAALAVIGFGFIGLVWPIDSFLTSFVPGPERRILVLLMLIGTLAFFCADEWLTRAVSAPRGAYVITKVAFLLSLALAVALDFEQLFFLVIILPVILLFFLVYGLLSGWVYCSTGHPWVAGLANAVAFAWAIGVTFPLLAG
jgi:pimeloyl-ACP methyl ester carboxylesterase